MLQQLLLVLGTGYGRGECWCTGRIHTRHDALNVKRFTGRAGVQHVRSKRRLLLDDRSSGRRTRRRWCNLLRGEQYIAAAINNGRRFWYRVKRCSRSDRFGRQDLNLRLRIRAAAGNGSSRCGRGADRFAG
uniref:Putative secreted protein n=1 Tax=Anopheles triannulatus TaxID=58253 RepID=A0A2M4B3S5_9DIPT